MWYQKHINKKQQPEYFVIIEAINETTLSPINWAIAIFESHVIDTTSKQELTIEEDG